MSLAIRNNPFGFIGLAIGIPALFLAMIPPLVIEPDPPKVSSVLEEGANLARKLLKRTPAPPPPEDSKKSMLHALRVTSICLGLLGTVLGLVAWIRKEHRRICLSAMGVGAMAALWVYVIAALVVGLILFVLLWLISEGA